MSDDDHPPTARELAARSSGSGIVCQNCKGTSMPVLYSRRESDGQTWRNRKCRICGFRAWYLETFQGEYEPPRTGPVR